MTSRQTEHPKTPLARNIKAAREEKGWTQRELARKVNDVDSLAVSRWERGMSRPTDHNLITLALVLGRDLSWFYTDHKAAA